MPSRNNYKRMRLHWMHNGTRLLPLQYYPLALKTENYSPNMDKSHSLRKIYFSLHTLPSKTLDYLTYHVIPGETSPQAPKVRVTSSSSLQKRQATSNTTPLDQLDSTTKMPMLSYN